MSDEPRLPRSCSYLGHQQGPETWYPLVLVVQENDKLVVPPRGLVAKTERRSRVIGTIVSEAFEAFLAVHRDAMPSGVKHTHPTFSLVSLLGSPVKVVKEADVAT